MTTTDLKTGLSEREAALRLERFGRNELKKTARGGFLKKALATLCEPMFLLLAAAALIYFFLGEARDGAIMFAFVGVMIAIDIIQGWKTDRTLAALNELSAPTVRVIRDSNEREIQSALLVPGDIMLISEGVKIPADAKILRSNDLYVDESTLTGESVSAFKFVCEDDEDAFFQQNMCYAGTLVTQGSATVLVTHTGIATQYGKIGENIAAAKEELTPLQKQTGSLVKICAGLAAVLFALVSGITYWNLSLKGVELPIVESLLSGITLAMAMIPEEFPVILTVFLSMGAWRLAKKNSLVRRLPSVETLGAVSVLCVDKTGTITQNRMTVSEILAFGDEDELIETMGLACETDAYDPMEHAMLIYCEDMGIGREHIFGGELISEYAFSNEDKMMGHVWHHDGEIIIAAKGSPENLFKICDTSKDTLERAKNEMERMSEKGLRVIAVGIMKLNEGEPIPASLCECRLSLLGLCALYDPPREGVREDILAARRAGIRVVMITGDNALTARSIAREVGMDADGEIITGNDIERMSDDELREHVMSASIFSRVIPEHKMRIVKAFRDNGETVAMTGDGVNDAPALKLADIGIAMGKRGSEVSREAADLILTDDNFSTVVDTVRDARRIYDNIKKAIGYVFAIHIPISLSSLFAPLLGIGMEELMILPLHVVLMELIIDPTCSIVLERQPAESDIMERGPRGRGEKLVTKGSLVLSTFVGLTVFAASFFTYYLQLKSGASVEVARTMGLGVLMLSNIFLVQVSSSRVDYAYTTFKKLLKDKTMWIANIAIIVGFAAIVYTPLNAVLKLAPLSLDRLALVVLLAAASVVWVEAVKFIKKLSKGRISSPR